jgi:hypothetical protein
MLSCLYYLFFENIEIERNKLPKEIDYDYHLRKENIQESINKIRELDGIRYLDLKNQINDIEEKIIDLLYYYQYAISINSFDEINNKEYKKEKDFKNHIEYYTKTKYNKKLHRSSFYYIIKLELFEQIIKEVDSLDDYIKT